MLFVLRPLFLYNSGAVQFFLIIRDLRCICTFIGDQLCWVKLNGQATSVYIRPHSSECISERSESHSIKGTALHLSSYRPFKAQSMSCKCLVTMRNNKIKAAPLPPLLPPLIPGQYRPDCEDGSGSVMLWGCLNTFHMHCISTFSI